MASRSSRYSWLAIWVVSTIAVGLTIAAVRADWRGLLCLLLLPGWLLAFAAFDVLTVQRWREQLFGYWCADALQFDLLAQTLRRVPDLPPNTLEGMLSTLPHSEAARAPIWVRPRLQGYQSLEGRVAVAQLVACSVGWGATAGIFLVAAFASRPINLAGCLIVVAGVVSVRGLLKRHLRVRRSALIRFCVREGQIEANTVGQLKALGGVV